MTRLPTFTSAAQVWLLLQRVFISKHSLTNKSNYLTSVTFAELTKEGLHKNQKMSRKTKVIAKDSCIWVLL